MSDRDDHPAVQQGQGGQGQRRIDLGAEGTVAVKHPGGGAVGCDVPAVEQGDGDGGAVRGLGPQAPFAVLLRIDPGCRDRMSVVYGKIVMAGSGWSIMIRFTTR